MYTDLLIQLKNMQAVKKPNIKVPYSKMDESILKVLNGRGYIESFEKKGQKAKHYLDVKLKYNESGMGAITGVKFISKPSRRIYFGYQKIRPVKSGHGLLVISTSKGIMDGANAKKNRIGGAPLFEIW